MVAALAAAISSLALLNAYLRFGDFSPYGPATLEDRSYLLLAGYAGMFATILISPVPDYVLLPVYGYLSSLGLFNPASVFLACLTAAVLPIEYAAGRYAGRPLLLRGLSFFRITEREIKAADGWLGEHGKFSVFVATFVPFFYGVAAVAAGTLRMGWAAFMLDCVLGFGLRYGFLEWVGYYGVDVFSSSFDYSERWVFAVLLAVSLGYIAAHLARELSAQGRVGGSGPVLRGWAPVAHRHEPRFTLGEYKLTLSIYYANAKTRHVPSPSHILAGPGDIAETVIASGDPARVEQLAKLLRGPRLVNSNRGLLVYTGYRGDERVTLATHGIGGPSTSIVLEELHMLGAKTIVRFGTAGALVEGLGYGDFVVVTGAASAAGSLHEYVSEGSLPAVPDVGLTCRLAESCKRAGLNFREGIVYSSDAFYSQTFESLGRWVKLGAVAVEMECATLFTLGLARGFRTGALLMMSNSLVNKEEEALAPAPKLEPYAETGALAIFDALSSLADHT